MYKRLRGGFSHIWEIVDGVSGRYKYTKVHVFRKKKNWVENVLRNDLGYPELKIR